MSKFETRNSLMLTLSDNTDEFAIANAFVQDDRDRLTIFQRCHGAAEKSETKSRARAAVDAANLLWAVYE